MYKFKAGDRVQVDTAPYAKRHSRQLSITTFQDTGTVVYVSNYPSDMLPYAVEMDHPHPGECHDCVGHTKSDFGYWCNDTMLKPITIVPPSVKPQRMNILKALLIQAGSYHGKTEAK